MKSIGIFLGVEPNAGGMFQYAESLLNALRQMHDRGYEIQVAYVFSSWETVLSNYPFKATKMVAGKFGLRLADLTMIVRLPGSLARLFAGLFNPIPIQLSRRRCDLWIFPTQDALSYQVRLPVVATIHDLMHRYEPSFPEVSKNNRRLIRDHRFRNIASWARAILVDSKVGRKHVVESYGTNSNKIFVLPYVPPIHIVKTKEPEDFDKRYTLPKKFILYPAQFWTHKNHKRLIRVASAIRSRIPDISLVFTGGHGKAYEDIRSYVLELGMTDRITFMGYVPDQDLVGFYSRACAMMMPTFFGPTNIPPLEAFTCGCPTGVSNIYGMPEQVGDAALLFNPSSEEEIADVMEKLWVDDELCRQLISRGYDKTSKWGQKQFAETLQDILMRHWPAF